jgi:hypothetical protein
MKGAEISTNLKSATEAEFTTVVTSPENGNLNAHRNFVTP